MEFSLESLEVFLEEFLEVLLILSLEELLRCLV
jgi:hypothetical protein